MHIPDVTSRRAGRAPTGRRSALAGKLLALALILSSSTSNVSAVQQSETSQSAPAAAPHQKDILPSTGPEDDGPVTTSYGYAVFGKLKYPANFTHLDYTNPNAPKGGTYRFAQPGSYDSMNSFAVLGFAPFMLTFMYDSLLQRSLDEPASYYGLVAETISYPKDFAWAEFKMRPQARWHDGKPMTPEDVIFTVKAFRGMVAPSYRRIAQSIDKVVKTGPHSVRVYFVQKNNPTMPSIVAQMPILPKHYFETRDFTKPTLDPPLASGPYKVGGFSAGRWLELVRVKDYWGKDLPINKGRYNFDSVRHDFYRDESMRNRAFLTGQADIRSEDSAERWADENKMPVFKARNIVRADIPYSNGAYYQGITLNTRVPALADRRVRKAILLSYDNEWVVRVLMAGHYGRLRSFFDNTPFSSANSLPSRDELKLLAPFRKDLPPELFTTPPQLPEGGTWGNRRHNLIEAAALLRKAGYHMDDGKLIDPHTHQQMKLTLMTGSVLNDRQVSLFLENLKQLGIEVAFRSFDSAQFRNRMRNYDYDMVLAGRSFAPLAAPGLEMLQAWSSKAAATPSSTNYSGISSPAVDALLSALITAKDRSTVVAAMRAIDRVALWNYYSIPFQHAFPAPIGHNPIAYWNKFGRPKIEPTYYFPYMLMEHWWVDKAKEAKLSYGVYGQR